MCCKALTVLGFVLIMDGAAFAQEETLVPFQAGAAAFAEGKKLVDEGKDSRASFREAMKAFGRREAPIRTAQAQNLGNAAFLAAELPLAILAFRLGLYYDRHHAVLRENLAYARSQVRYPPNSQRGRPEVDVWPSWLPRRPIAWYLWVGAAAYCVAWSALTAFVCMRRLWLAAVALCCFGIAAAAAYACNLIALQWRQDVAEPLLVVRYDGVALRTGNGPSYPQHAELPTLARGMEARERAARGDWLQIQFASGEVGWVRTQDVLRWVDLRPDSALWK